MGAQSNFNEKGQEHKAKMALALYTAAAADEVECGDGAIDDNKRDVAAVADEAAAVDAKTLNFCCIRNGIEAERPIGIPCSVYSTMRSA